MKNYYLPQIKDVMVIGQALNELHVSFTNENEPKYCKNYFIQLIRSNATKSGWSAENLCVYNFKNDQYESINGLYSELLLEQIIQTILYRLESNIEIKDTKKEAM